VIVFVPTFRLILPEALPLETVVPFTLTVAFASVTVGVTVIELVAFDTEAVYVVVPLAKTGLSVPLDSARLLSVATLDGAARVTVVV
jgi:hypothetical protein